VNVDVLVTGLNPTVLTNLSRLAVTLDGDLAPIAQILPQPGGVYLIRVQLAPTATGALAVWVDGSSWPPVPIPAINPVP
jgi:hypothetical protein